MVATDKTPNAWSCTNIGSFIGGVGISKPTVIFTLPRRPAKVIFRGSEVGDWTPQAWNMEEYQPTTGKWETVAGIVDAEKAEDQEFYVQLSGTAESPAQWTIDYAACGGQSAEKIDVVPSIDPPSMSATFTEARDLNLASTGNFAFDSGHGLAIDGDFGTITIGGEIYETRQLTFNFPSNRRSPDGNPAEGEMHIILQKRGALGIFDLAVVDVLLQLKEEGAEDDATRGFFLSLGLETLPRQGEPNAINGSIDLKAFLPHIAAGSVMVPSCSAYTPWYVLGKPAYITGSIQQAFIDGPPDPTPMPTTYLQTLANLTEEQIAVAMYDKGMKPDGSPLITAEEKAAIARGPAPLEKPKPGPAVDPSPTGPPAE
jgi:carbonic anhydrase